jgi:hypothetical protein
MNAGGRRRKPLAIGLGLALAAALAATAIGVAAQRSGDTLSLPSAIEAANLQERALNLAHNRGEPKPYGGILVATTQERFFDSRQGAEFPYDRDVFVVSLRGRFTAYGASRPAGAPAPTGTFSYIVVDASSLETIAVGIGEPTDTSILGPSLRFGPQTESEAMASG